MSSNKILIVTSEFPPQPGGIGNHALNLAIHLKEHGFQVYVMADIRSKDGELEKELDTTLPFTIYRNKRYSVNLFTYLMRIIVFIRIANNFSKVIASGKFPLWLVGFYPFLSKKKKNVVIHGSEVNLEGFYKKITNYALLNFNKIIAVSNFTKSLISDKKLTNIVVIPNGFAVSNFNSSQPINKTQVNDNPILITVGNVSERKGQLNVIKSLPKLLKRYPKLHYHIVGINSEINAFKKEATAIGVLKHITFHGRVDEQEKNRLLFESDIFMMLSEQTSTGDVEGFGIAILEANAIGLPAIGSRNCGIEDAILVNNSGLLVSPKNCEEICSAVELIWNNFPVYKKNAIAWSNEFCWQKIILKYLEVIWK